MQGADVDTVWTSYLAADETGNRMDAHRAYLAPVRAAGVCGNLQVVEGATVTEVLLDGNATATGVAYQKGPNGDLEVQASGGLKLSVRMPRAYVLFPLCHELKIPPLQ